MASAKQNGGPAVDQTTAPAKHVPFLTPEQRDILAKSALCEKLDENQKAYFFEVVERTRLDPFTGQIRPDVRHKTEEDGNKTPTFLIITTLQGLRSIGDRSGQLDGESTPEWCGEDGQWKDVWLESAPPKAARASVYRKDRPRAQIQVCRWDAYVQLKWGQSGDPIPNPFWKRMGSHMLGKCSLAGAYRGAFPNQCSGLYISEELQDVLDPDSEEAIEAEMIRRARAEKEYWDKERLKGNLPIDEVQRLEREQHPQPGPNGPVPGIDLGVIPTLPQVSAAPPLPRITAPAPPPPPPPPQPAWPDFVINRIEALRGRTVGSLTIGEVNGLTGLLGRMQESWGGLDADLKAHYMAIRERILWDQAHPATASLEFSVT
jgi:phage recombination protein Bet